MKTILDKIKELALTHDQIPPEIIKEKDIKLGLRNLDGTGVIVGITTKGRIIGYEVQPDPSSFTGKKIIPVDGKLYYCGYDVNDIIEYNEKHKRFGFEEVIYLLLTNVLPNKGDLEIFSSILHKRSKLTNLERRIIMGEVENFNQMYALHSVISHLSRCDKNPDSTDIGCQRAVYKYHC